MIKIRYSILTLLFSFLSVGVSANDTTNSKEAQALFTKVYNMVYGEQGSMLTYDVNIIGIYKTKGTIYQKGKKFHYQEERHSSWQDGVTAYLVDNKKKAVNVYGYDDEAKDSYLSKFKFKAEDYIFSYKTEGDYYLITAKVKNSSFFGIKELVAKVLKKNLHPSSLSIKLGFMRTTVKITNFKSGNINDSLFIFPRSKFNGYTFTDHRYAKK